MSKEQIRKAYRAREMSYEDALEKLEALGMSEGDADAWLWNGYNGDKID
jgi:hypothetical protein